MSMVPMVDMRTMMIYYYYYLHMKNHLFEMSNGKVAIN